MNLLPRSSREFGSADYWEKFFQQRGKKAFEWYGSYLDLCGVLHKYIKAKDKVLVVGCGNSELSEQLYDVGYQDIVNIDISEVVIKQMKERNAGRRPQMSFLQMDMTKMELPDASFQVVLDKGTLDAVLTDEEEKTLEKVDRMLAEVGRVLQVGGRYLCISLAQTHILKKVVGHFSREGWMVRVHQVTNSQNQSSETEPQFSLPVFAFIMTKFRPVSGSAFQILELCAQEQGKPVRLENTERLAEAVRERQRYAWLRSQLSRKAGPGSVSLDLCDGSTGEPRYTLHVVDTPTVKLSRDNHFAIFITQKKRKKDKKKLRPADALENPPVPESQPIDKSFLCCEHHKAMVAGLALLKNPGMLPEASLSFLVVGLGGGSLPLFIHDHFLKSHVDAVEIDPSMLEVATRWFGFTQSDRMKVHIADGLDYITNLAREAQARYDVIMFDVDSKDPTVGMSCPPPAFVDHAFLQNVKGILTQEGVFILNLVCRDSGLKDSVLAGLKKVFPLLYVRQIEGEVNEILFCQLQPEHKLATPELLEMAQALERTLRRPGKGFDSTYVLSDMLKTVKIV
ncbi:eEF1A lysine and N-terminal methyltransferase isoform X2 [Phascolarctos cinereus]|uniref:eEF1A lysine and N-terminal methyltransferase n=1 Tax=Phascolarctos cinereus TaxID=38626 RepID=A0A6P5J576_PHACI|nr:methyltransferase-like protein 13 isoform X2 [Phascolarctos cinereus]